MTRSNLLRWDGVIAVLAGLLVIAVSFLPQELRFPGPLAPSDPTRWLYWAVGLTTLFALIGVYTIQIEESGVWGLAGFSLATIGNALFLAEDVAILAGSIMAAGIVLLGIGTWTGGKLPRWIPGLWFASVLIGLPGAFLDNMAHTLNVIGGIPFALAFIGAGYILWTRTGERMA